VFDNSAVNFQAERLPGSPPSSHRAHRESLHSSGILARHPHSPRVARQVINGRTLASRRLDGRAYWAIFRT